VTVLCWSDWLLQFMYRTAFIQFIVAGLVLVVVLVVVVVVVVVVVMRCGWCVQE